MEAPLAHLGNGLPAPDFSLTALDGKEYSLASLLQRGPVVIAFFKISCPVCQFTLPFIQRIADHFAGKNVCVMGVSQDDVRDTKEFNREFGVKLPTLVDRKGYPVSSAYRLTNVPTIFLVAPDGKITTNCTGFDKAVLEQIAGALAEHEKISATPLFRKDEAVPAFKPG
jgi:peroxiredoxin